MEVEPAAYGSERALPLSFPVMDVDTLGIIGSVFGTGLALAVLMMRITARLDADRRAFEAKADADRRASDAARRAYEARADADRRAHQASMDAFRAEMREIAERQARVEGPLSGQAGPAD